MLELTESCGLDKSIVDSILLSLSVLNKEIEKYSPSLDVLVSLDWVRDSFVLSVFESAELTVAEEDELMEVRNNRRLKLKET
jgi:hypothetical protein